MKTAIPAAVENRPWLALAVIVGVCAYPAAQVTIAEWKDAVDASKTTQWQPELVIDAWFNAGRTFALAIYAYLTRSGAKSQDQ